MEVNPGYRRTEVGVIPEGWDVLPITSVLQKGSRITYGVVKPGPSRDDGVLFIRGGDVLDGKILTDQLRRISEVISNQYKRTCLSGGELVISLVGYPGEVALVPRSLAGANIARQVALVRLDSTRPLSGDYICKFLQSNQGRRLLLKESIGSAQQVINLRDITRVLLVLPPESEQRTIATALSDVDGLLGGLDRLIAKKRDLKQAAMQQLLTGQTRLPGFQGEWEVKRLQQVAEISTGINKPLSEMGSGALYVTVQDLYDKTSIRTERLGRIKVSPSEIETRGLMVGDIVFGKSSVKRDGIGYPSQFLGCDEPVVFSGFAYRARARQGITDATFLFYALREEKTRRWLIDSSQASALTNINQTIAEAIPVQVPPSVPEQTAIALVLSEMDVESAALELQREKTLALKQAMMQELLTGRTRLV